MKKRVLFLSVLLVVAIFALPFVAMGQKENVEMTIGEQRILDGTNVKRIAIGDESIANVQISEDQEEIIITAISPGSTALSIWSKDDKQRTMLINVYKTDPRVMLEQVRQMLGDMEGPVLKTMGGKIIIDGETLTDADKARVEKVVDLFEGQVVNLTQHSPMILPTENIVMDFYVVEISKGRSKDFGINWADSLDVDANLSTDTLITGGFGGLDTTGSGNFGVTANFGASLRMAELNNTARTHDRHRIITQSGTSAEYLAGGEILVRLLGSEAVELEKVPIGTYITATPLIDPSGLMRVNIDVEVSVVAGTNAATGDITLNKRKIKNTVNLKKGETLALSGLLQDFDTKAVDAVPGLGKLPVLGYLFKSEQFQKGQSEAVIFITPNVVTPDSAESKELIGGIISEYEQPME
jgi:pilus assembly protein CpaC